MLHKLNSRRTHLEMNHRLISIETGEKSELRWLERKFLRCRSYRSRKKRNNVNRLFWSKTKSLPESRYQYYPTNQCAFWWPLRNQNQIVKLISKFTKFLNKLISFYCSNKSELLSQWNIHNCFKVRFRMWLITKRTTSAKWASITNSKIS
jgi:hypothetical protein